VATSRAFESVHHYSLTALSPVEAAPHMHSILPEPRRQIVAVGRCSALFQGEPRKVGRSAIGARG
jgi:hypothetical protein